MYELFFIFREIKYEALGIHVLVIIVSFPNNEYLDYFTNQIFFSQCFSPNCDTIDGLRADKNFTKVPL